MTIERALIAQPARIGSSQWLQTEVQVNCDDTELKFVFSSIGADGRVSVTHARCSLTYAAAANLNWMNERVSKTLENISSLQRCLTSESCYRFNSSMVYRMVAVLADFDRGYRGLKEVILDSNAMAAASKVDFSALPRREGETYSVHPAYLDSLTQSAGFVMNANEASDLEVECFVNHGWEALTFFEPLRAFREYQSYVQMSQQAGSSGVWKGTLTVVSGDTLVAVIDGITVSL